MTTQNFGYYEEIFFPEDENEWIDSSVFSEVKDLWLKSNNLRGDANYLKACKLLNPFFDVDFDPGYKVVDYRYDTCQWGIARTFTHTVYGKM